MNGTSSSPIRPFLTNSRLFTVAIIMRCALFPKKVVHSQLGLLWTWREDSGSSGCCHPKNHSKTQQLKTKIYCYFHVSTGWLGSAEWFSTQCCSWDCTCMLAGLQHLKSQQFWMSEMAHSHDESWCWLLAGISVVLLTTASPDGLDFSQNGG